MDHFELPLTLRTGVPLQLALVEALREEMLRGRLRPGDALPSTRALCEQLEVSRGVVVGAFEQLIGEGYLSARGGSGTVVSAVLPDESFEAPRSPQALRPSTARITPVLSRWAREFTSPFHIRETGTPRPFRPHVPAVDAFPVELWSRLVARRARRDEAVWLESAEVAGYLPLRRAIAAQLRASRAVKTSADCIVILPSLQQALEVTARLLVERGDSVWLEEPGYVGASAVFRAAGAKLIPVAVDDRGMVVSEARARAPRARLAYVTPGHQWPLGVTMAIERRLELLAWAREQKRYVFEDDYDSEFRYEGRPVPALKSLDGDDLVIHAGAFSKTMLPSLRLAYVALPERLVEPFIAVKSIVDRHTMVLPQAALADFIEEGHFGRHLRRMRGLYAERRSALLDALEQELRGAVQPIGARAGLGLAVRLPPGSDDVTVAAALEKQRVMSMPISPGALRGSTEGGLLLGFAPYAPGRLRNAVEVVARVLAQKRAGPASRRR